MGEGGKKKKGGIGPRYNRGYPEEGGGGDQQTRSTVSCLGEKKKKKKSWTAEPNRSPASPLRALLGGDKKKRGISSGSLSGGGLKEKRKEFGKRSHERKRVNIRGGGGGRTRKRERGKKSLLLKGYALLGERNVAHAKLRTEGKGKRTFRSLLRRGEGNKEGGIP